MSQDKRKATPKLFKDSTKPDINESFEHFRKTIHNKESIFLFLKLNFYLIAIEINSNAIKAHKRVESNQSYISNHNRKTSLYSGYGNESAADIYNFNTKELDYPTLKLDGKLNFKRPNMDFSGISGSNIELENLEETEREMQWFEK